jgi:hypothetical protein
LAKPNFRHSKKQRELAKKTRQQEKLQRKAARIAERDTPGNGEISTAEDQVTPEDQNAPVSPQP